MVRLGARGYVTKDISSTDLADAIRKVAPGDAVFSPRLAGFVLDAFAGKAAVADDELDRLTQREREVMQLVVAGKLNKQVADELGIGIATLYRKLKQYGFKQAE